MEDKELREKLMNLSVKLRADLTDNTIRKPAYTITNMKLELENDKVTRYNFYLTPALPFLQELNIKLNIKDKDLKTIYSELRAKTIQTLSDNNFMKTALDIARKLVGKDAISVLPILYQEKTIVYVVGINQKVVGKECNNKASTSELLKKWGVYDINPDYIDFYQLANQKKESHKLLLDKLSIKEKATYQDLIDVANDTEDKDRDELYKFFSKFLKDDEFESKIPAIYKYFLQRTKYIKVYNEITKDLPATSKYLTLKWLQEEFNYNFIVKDPNEFNFIYEMEFVNLPEKTKECIDKIENLLKSFWQKQEDKFNSFLKVKGIKNFRIALSQFDFILNKFKVYAISLNKMKEYEINLNNVAEGISKISEDFKEA